MWISILFLSLLKSDQNNIQKFLANNLIYPLSVFRFYSTSRKTFALKIKIKFKKIVINWNYKCTIRKIKWQSIGFLHIESTSMHSKLCMRSINDSGTLYLYSPPFPVRSAIIPKNIGTSENMSFTIRIKIEKSIGYNQNRLKRSHLNKPVLLSLGWVSQKIGQSKLNRKKE